MSRAFAFFERVISLIHKQLERIAWSSEGDHSGDDLTSETWLIVDELHAEADAAPNPDDESVRDMIVARLQKQFGKFVNRKERFAVRLDRDDIDDLMPNSVGERLSAPEADEPLMALELREEAAAAALVIGNRFSEATCAPLNDSTATGCAWRATSRSARKRSHVVLLERSTWSVRNHRCSIASRPFLSISCRGLVA